MTKLRSLLVGVFLCVLSTGPVWSQPLDGSVASELQSRLAAQGVGGCAIDLNVRVPVPGTPDDPPVDLWATVIRHEGEQLPTILIATPYRRELMLLLYLSLVGQGYHVMAIDIRGTGSSEGEWVSFGPAEHFDTAHVVDQWIPTQPWSDGSVGMIGPSYMAIIQMVAAGQIERDAAGDPVHLKAMFPLVSMSDAYRDIVMQGGNIDLEFIPMWLGMVDVLSILPPVLLWGNPTPEEVEEAAAILQQHRDQIPITVGWIMDPSNAVKSDFYETKSPMIYWPEQPEGGWNFPNYPYLNAGGANTIPDRLPVFLTGGWYDIFTRGTLNNYTHGLAAHGAGDKALIVGPWYHLDGSLGLGIDGLMTGTLPARWFNWKIKGRNDPFMVRFPVVLYVEGAKRWRAERTWPLPASRVEARTLYVSKKRPSNIPGDWFSALNAGWNYKLVEQPGFSDYNDRFLIWTWRRPDPVLVHDPGALHGLLSRSFARWMMGLPALAAQVSKLLLGNDIDEKMFFEDERLDEWGVLTFTTEPLSRDLEISGPLTLTFWARTDFTESPSGDAAEQLIEDIRTRFNIDENLLLDAMDKDDVQWVVELNDVFPNGRAKNITSGWLSAWHRPYDPADERRLDPAYLADPLNPFYHHADKNPAPIEENVLYPYVVEVWPADNVFKAGHRIRVSISASDFPHLLPIVHPSRSTVVVDESHAARLDFKVVTKGTEGVDWKWIDNVDDYLATHSD
jgi:uncharacterized protein